MARKKAHEDHANHEAWAIPYGDLVTLLLALFVVLYSMSSVNEGKYRVLSDSLNEAFGGRPRSPLPIQVGEHEPHGTNSAPRIAPIARRGASVDRSASQNGPVSRPLGFIDGMVKAAGRFSEASGKTGLERMSENVNAAMSELIAKKLVVVRQLPFSLEIEIRTDILFPSGVAQLSDAAQPVLSKLAASLKPFPNPIRIEGHTDNMPISTMAFPSNWQLSASRAASVVALFMQQGVDPMRMIVAGFGEYHPIAANDTAEGRNRNRRVLIVVLGGPDDAAITAGLGQTTPDEANDATANESGAAGPSSVAPGPLARLQTPVWDATMTAATAAAPQRGRP